MSFLDIALPSVWDVPVAAGVPALLGQSVETGISASISSSLAGAVENWTTSQESKKWGIYDSSGKQFATSARVMSIDYETAYSVSDAPLADGAFASYNKVKRPFSSRVVLVCDGTESGSSDVLAVLKSLTGITGDLSTHVRTSFLSSLETAVADTNLYSVATPEKTYVNANIIGYRLRRASNEGITMIVAEIALEEIRNKATTYYTNTKTASGSQPVPNGTVQTTPVPSIVPQSLLS